MLLTALSEQRQLPLDRTAFANGRCGLLEQFARVVDRQAPRPIAGAAPQALLATWRRIESSLKQMVQFMPKMISELSSTGGGGHGHGRPPAVAPVSEACARYCELAVGVGGLLLSRLPHVLCQNSGVTVGTLIEKVLTPPALSCVVATLRPSPLRPTPPRSQPPPRPSTAARPSRRCSFLRRSRLPRPSLSVPTSTASSAVCASSPCLLTRCRARDEHVTNP